MTAPLEARELHPPAGSAAEDGDPVAVTPERAGWAYSGLRVIRLRPRESRTIETGGGGKAVPPPPGAGPGGGGGPPRRPPRPRGGLSPLGGFPPLPAPGPGAGA